MLFMEMACRIITFKLSKRKYKHDRKQSFVVSIPIKENFRSDLRFRKNVVIVEINKTICRCLDVRKYIITNEFYFYNF